MKWSMSRSKFILVVVIILVLAISYGILSVVRNQSSSADLRTRSLRNRPVKPLTISGVGVRLIATSREQVISTGVTDPAIKFAALHLAVGAAIENTEQAWNNPQLNLSTINSFFAVWKDSPDVELTIDINGLGAKNTVSNSPTLAGPVPEKVLDRLGPSGTITYTALLNDTGQPVTRRLPNPCNRRWLNWYSKFIHDAGQKLDGHPRLGGILFATGMNNGLSLGNEEISTKFAQLGCTREMFTRATKIILREVKRAFPRTPVLVGMSQIVGVADEFELDRPYLADILDTAYKLGFAGAETHTLSGNVKKLNKKSVYYVLSDFVRQYPDFIVIDGPDDPLVKSLNLETESDEEITDPICDNQTHRNLGDFKCVTQAALNQLSGVNFTLPRQAIKFYSPEVKIHEQTKNSEIDEAFSAINAALYKKSL